MYLPSAENHDSRSSRHAPNFGGNAPTTKNNSNPSPAWNSAAVFSARHHSQLGFDAAAQSIANDATFSRDEQFLRYRSNGPRPFPSMDRAGFNTAHSSYCPCCFSTISSPDQTDPGFGAGAVVPHSFGGPYRNFSPPPVHSPGMPQTTDGSNGNQRSWFNNPYDTQSDHGALTAVQSSKKQISFDVSHDHLPPSGRKSQRPQSILKKSRNTPKYTKGPQSEPQIQFAGASSLKSHGVGAIEALGPISNWSNNCYTFDNTLGFSASNAGSSSGRASLLGQGLLQCGFPAPGRASISGQGILQRGPAAPHNPMKPSGQGFLQPCSPACTPTKSSASGQGFLQSCAPAPHNTNGSGEGSAQNNNDPSFQKALQAFQGSWNLFIDTPPPEYMKTLLAQAIAHNINIQRFTENGEIDERALADFIYDSAPTCQVLLSGMSMNVTPDEITAAIHEGALQSIYFEASMSWVKEGDLEVEVTFKTRHAAERFLQRGISKQILIRGEQVQCEWSAKRISEVKPWEKDQTRILQVCGPDTHEFCVPQNMEAYQRKKDQCDILSSPKWMRYRGKGFIQFEFASIRKCRHALSCLRERFQQLGCQNDFEVRFGPDPCDRG